MTRLRVNEAIARAENRGKRVLKKDLAAKLWPNSVPEAQQVNMTNLCTGKTRKIDPAMVNIICEELDCSADFLFGQTND